MLQRKELQALAYLRSPLKQNVAALLQYHLSFALILSAVRH